MIIKIGRIASFLQIKYLHEEEHAANILLHIFNEYPIIFEKGQWMMEFLGSVVWKNTNVLCLLGWISTWRFTFHLSYELLTFCFMSEATSLLNHIQASYLDV